MLHWTGTATAAPVNRYRHRRTGAAPTKQKSTQSEMKRVDWIGLITETGQTQTPEVLSTSHKVSARLPAAPLPTPLPRPLCCCALAPCSCALAASFVCGRAVGVQSEVCYVHHTCTWSLRSHVHVVFEMVQFCAVLMLTHSTQSHHQVALVQLPRPLHLFVPPRNSNFIR